MSITMNKELGTTLTVIVEQPINLLFHYWLRKLFHVRQLIEAQCSHYGATRFTD
jgi:uncharacterized membrane protein